jgi:hypothetical protein
MYQFRLQRTDGSPADPPTYRSSTLNSRQGDEIPLTAERTLRVLSVRDDDADQPPALVVEDLPRAATTDAASFGEGSAARGGNPDSGRGRQLARWVPPEPVRDRRNGEGRGEAIGSTIATDDATQRISPTSTGVHGHRFDVAVGGRRPLGIAVAQNCPWPRLWKYL